MRKYYKLIGLFTIIVALLIAVIFKQKSFSLNDSKELDKKIYVGYSKVSITPPSDEFEKIPLGGSGNSYARLATFDNENQKYMQDLYSTAVAMKDQDDNIAIFVTVDLLQLTDSNIRQIKDYMASETDIKTENVFIASTHTHSAPDTGFSYSDYPELNAIVNKYIQYISKQITISCSNAINDLKLANIYYGTVDIVDENNNNVLNFVRHYETQNTNFLGNKVYSGDNHGVIYWDGNSMQASKAISHIKDADPTLQMIKFTFDDTSDKDILMINWQVHPHITGGAVSPTISSDLIGLLRDEIESKINCKVAYFTGASGNVSWNTSINDGSEGIEGINYNYTNETSQQKYDITSQYSKKLSEYVINSYNALEKVQGKYISFKKEYLNLSSNKKQRDSALYINALFCLKIWRESYENVIKMITGEYNWGTDYVFPDGFDNTGAKLRSIISKSATLRSYFTVTGNDQQGYNCELSDTFNLANLRVFVVVIGSQFEDIIYSPYHANSIVTLSNPSYSDTRKIEINAITLGDISFVTVPYEMFDTNGQYVKENSKSKMTFVLELTNGQIGYVPSEDAYDYGCYEADTTTVKKGSGETVARKLVSMISEITKEISKITVNQLPTKTKYIVNNDVLDLDGGELTITYNDNTTNVISLKNEFVTVNGFDNSKIGNNQIVVNYEGKQTTFNIQIVEKSDLGKIQQIVNVPSTSSNKNNIYNIISLISLLIGIGVLLSMVLIKKK